MLMSAPGALLGVRLLSQIQPWIGSVGSIIGAYKYLGGHLTYGGAYH
jgi:hypothetical protein